jgi:hypothetical protein
LFTERYLNPVEHVRNGEDRKKNARTRDDMKESIQDAMPSISPAEIRRAMNVFVIACAARLRAEANHRQQFFLGHFT